MRDLFQLKPLERLNLVLEVDETARDLNAFNKKREIKVQKERIFRVCDLIRMPETFLWK